MERTVLTSLKFRINMPTARTFWSVYQLGHAMHISSASMANYLMVCTKTPSYVGSMLLCTLSTVCLLNSTLTRFLPHPLFLCTLCILQELAQLEYSFLQFEPSRLAAAALLVAESHTGTPGSAVSMGQYLSGVTGYPVSCLQVNLEFERTYFLS